MAVLSRKNMTTEEIIAITQNISCPPFTIEIEEDRFGTVPSSPYGALNVTIYNKVRDVHTGKEITIQSHHYISIRMVQYAKDPIDMIIQSFRRWFHEAVIHEVDEQFLYKDNRPFYPHPGIPKNETSV